MHSYVCIKSEIGEFLEFLGISCGFPIFDFQAFKAWNPLHLGTERYIMLLHVPGSAPHLGQLESTCENHGGLHNLNEMSVVRN